MQTLAIIGSGISGPARLDKGILACHAPAPLSRLSLGGTAAGQHLFQELFG
jgi:hypothetical protein